MKKFLYYTISIMLAISFFFVHFVPVFADYDYDTYVIEGSQVTAYTYWNLYGYDLITQNSNNTTIHIPQYVENTGNTNWQLICNEPNYTGQEGDYACYFRNSSTGQIYNYWYQTTNLAHDETVQNISIHGVEVPWLSTSNLLHPTSYNHSLRINVPTNGSVYIAFYSTKNSWSSTSLSSDLTENNFVRGYSQNGTKNIPFNQINFTQNAGIYYSSFEIGGGNHAAYNVTLDWVNLDNNTKIIPVYIGTGVDLNDFQKQELGIETTTESYLNSISSKMESILTLNNTQTQAAVATNNNLISGNPTSQAAQSALNNSNTTLNNRVDQMNSIETEYNSNLNNALNDIDLSTDLVQHTGFTNAALWVSAQFNRLVLGTPFELVMTFSLITGLALVLIGKMRG